MVMAGLQTFANVEGRIERGRVTMFCINPLRAGGRWRSWRDPEQYPFRLYCRWSFRLTMQRERLI